MFSVPDGRAANHARHDDLEAADRRVVPRRRGEAGDDRLPRERADRGHGYVTIQGFAFQIPAAYSAIVRSLENLPDAATLRMAFRAQPSRSA